MDADIKSKTSTGLMFYVTCPVNSAEALRPSQSLHAICAFFITGACKALLLILGVISHLGPHKPGSCLFSMTRLNQQEQTTLVQGG